VVYQVARGKYQAVPWQAHPGTRHIQVQAHPGTSRHIQVPGTSRYIQVHPGTSRYIQVPGTSRYQIADTTYQIPDTRHQLGATQYTTTLMLVHVSLHCCRVSCRGTAGAASSLPRPGLSWRRPYNAPLATTMQPDDVHAERMLNDVWCLSFHDPDNEDWTLPSYVHVADLSSVEEFWAVHAMLQDNLKHGMFFLCREGILPCWDDPANIHGGCLSMKVAKDEVARFWEQLAARTLGESLLSDGCDTQLVNGISTSPKRQFCIIKIWMRDASLTDRKFFRLPEAYTAECLWKNNLLSIQSNAAFKAGGASSTGSDAITHRSRQPASAAPGTT
jgi:hypothetical protein